MGAKRLLAKAKRFKIQRIRHGQIRGSAFSAIEAAQTVDPGFGPELVVMKPAHSARSTTLEISRQPLRL